MTTTNTNRAVLTFHSQLGEIVRFSIPRARMDKTADSARASMEAIIEGGAVVTGNGTPTAVHGAKLINTIRTQIV